MTTALKSLERFFPSGTAEGDVSFLDRAFVTPQDYMTIVDVPSGSPRILVGKKGSGKTAILETVRMNSEANGIPAILLRPDDIHLEDTKDLAMASLKRKSYASLLEAVAVKLGSGLKGLISSKDAVLFEEAVRRGANARDFVQRVLKPLAGIGKQVSGLDMATFIPEATQTASSELLAAVKNRFAEDNSVFFLLIDDTDQIAAPNESEHLNRIWSFFLATRKLSSEAPHVKSIVSVRTEVWLRLRNESGGQRDQIDHFRPLVVHLNPDNEHIRKILERRLELAIETQGEVSPGSLYEPFFVGESLVLPTSEQHRYWHDYLVKSARERPRDVIQLVGMLSGAAIAAGEEKITSRTVERCSVRYSEERIDDVCLEFDRDCSELRAIVDSFSSIDFEVPGQVIRSHLESIPSAFSITVRGRIIQPHQVSDALVVWSLLYESGFLNPRFVDKRNNRYRDGLLIEGYRHGSFREDPDLVSASRWNEIINCIWEVHPAYRSYLLKLREDKRAMKNLRSDDQRAQAGSRGDHKRANTWSTKGRRRRR